MPLFSRSCPHPLAIAAAPLLALLALATLAQDAGAIPAFARRYSQSCNLCHGPFPRLTETGAKVASNGFRMAPGEVPPDAMNGGDDLLMLSKYIPLAVRVDGQFRVYGDKDETTSGFESPWVMKFLSSASIGRSFSYYFYFLLDERGEVAGAEDAFLYWNDAGGRPLDFALGQFQVSDPLFKRELRLPFDDYRVYTARVGDQPATLAYDRGLMLIAEPADLRITLELLNGDGLGTTDDARYDDDANKNLFAHVTRGFGSFLRLGALGYAGWQDGATGVSNSLWMAGGDATIRFAPCELNLQYVHREDDHPTFAAREPTDTMDGGFAELLVLPEGKRWYGYALYNRVQDDEALLDFGSSTPSGVDLFESVSVGAGYLVQRNLRMQGEALYDTQQEVSRWTLGFSTAF